MGLEGVYPADQLWDICFPPAENNPAGSPRALLEYKRSSAVGVLRKTIEEVDGLETSGILLTPRSAYRKVTPWSSSEQKIADQAEGVPAKDGAADEEERRPLRRPSLQLPVRLQDYNGDEEITQTRNVSGKGLSFVGKKPQLVGENIRVTCPCQMGRERIEVPARIMWRQDKRSMHRRFCGARYLP
jgi:hypothetical protein